MRSAKGSFMAGGAPVLIRREVGPGVKAQTGKVTISATSMLGQVNMRDVGE